MAGDGSIRPSVQGSETKGGGRTVEVSQKGGLPAAIKEFEAQPSITAVAIENEMDVEYPRGFAFFSIMVALCLSVFCVALDNTIIATATPRITDDFHSLDDVGWYGSAYLLTTCAFQLFYGKLYSLFTNKTIFLIALFIFEVGSAVCGSAPNSVALIIGRAIAGLGAAGLFSGGLIIIAHSTPIDTRPVYTGIAGMMYGLASVLGPLIGGAFTDHVTWRWCFYINLPLGAFTALIIVPFLHIKHEPAKKKSMGILWTLWQLDPLGTALFVPSIVCLLLALQWGGSTYSWSDGHVIALLVIFAATLVAFIAVQAWLQENATVPPRIFLQRTIAFAALFSITIGAAFFTFVYFIPIWFQAIKGVDALTSGIHSIPLILTMTVAIVVSGGLTTQFGYYVPYVYGSVVLTSIGSGLITTWKPDTGIGQWIGYQIVFGFGCGLAFQLPQIAAQTVLRTEDIAIGVAITFFCETFGGAVFVSVGNNILNNRLIEYISALNIDSVNAHKIIDLGATELRSYVPAQYVDRTVEAYNKALINTFQVALICSCLCALGAAGMEWQSVKAPVANADTRNIGHEMCHTEGGQSEARGQSAKASEA